MNTDDRLLQILENSACLSKGQLTGYIKRTLYPEELRAVELHLSSCALCNDALEGLEMQQDVDQLIASMVPPVLPVIVPKEKSREKIEKTEAAVPPTKGNVLTHQEQNNGGQNTIPSLRPQNTWRKPLAVAAALVIGFGAIWYFTFNKDNGKQLALQTEKIKDSLNHPKGPTENAALLAKTTAENEAKVKEEAKKHTDSLAIVKREEQKRKARKDSLMLASAAKGDSGKNPAATQSIAAIKSAADEAESTEVTAKKVAAPAMAKAKEESKKELSDYELGLQQYKEKNYASALLYFKSAESDKSDPKHWDAVFYSGICNRNLNKDRKARKMFERIVDADAPQKKAAQKQLDDMKKGD